MIGDIVVTVLYVFVVNVGLISIFQLRFTNNKQYINGLILAMIEVVAIIILLLLIGEFTLLSIITFMLLFGLIGCNILFPLLFPITQYTKIPTPITQRLIALYHIIVFSGLGVLLHYI